VTEDQWDRVRSDAGLAQEVHGDTADIDAVVIVGVDRALGRAPVVPVSPVLDQGLQAGTTYAVEAVVVPGVERPLGRGEPAAQVVEDLVGDMDGG
jgi:hypothetical protein